jgi:hemoglobin-like flavoprotein
MTPKQIELVQASFALVKPISAAAGRMFYGRLFTIDPTLESLFHGDMEEQSRKLMEMIGTAVAMLRRPDQLAPALEGLGRRHAGYGVQDEHYATVAAALIWTLQEGLGEAFTAEIRDAWVAMYEWITGKMRGAAAAAAA